MLNWYQILTQGGHMEPNLHRMMKRPGFRYAADRYLAACQWRKVKVLW